MKLFYIYFTFLAILGCENRQDNNKLLVITDLNENLSNANGELDKIVSVNFTSRDSFKLIINCDKLTIPKGKSKIKISDYTIWNGGVVHATNSVLTFEGFNRHDDEKLLDILKKENVAIIEFNSVSQNRGFSEDHARKDVKRILKLK